MSLLRKLVHPELVTLVGWAEQEGWEPGHYDAEQFWNYDPEGFLAIEEDGEFLGGGAIIKHIVINLDSWGCLSCLLREARKGARHTLVVCPTGHLT